MSTFVVPLAMASAAALGASDVMNIELVTQVAANAVHMMYDPILRAVGPGSEPYRPGMLRMTGKIVPALRAVFEGVPGARTRSAIAIAYPKPSVWPPSDFTKRRATRRPRPVLLYPMEKTNAPKMSHTVVSEKPLSAQAIDLFMLSSTKPSVAAIAMPIMPIAAAGIGSRIKPIMTAINKEK